MTNLSFQYPSWFILFCILAGLVYALLLYYKDSTFKEQSKRINWGLGALRFLSVSGIAILLLSPVLRSLFTETKKPIIVLAQDHSESIADAIQDTTAYINNFRALQEALSEDYEVKEFGFGSKVRENIDFQFKDKTSNLSDVLTTAYDLYSNQNLGAVVLASDGIYNVGSSPVYAGTKLNVPIYTIALGDTTPKKDVILKRVFHNKIAYLGDRFSIQADVTAQNAQGNATKLTISKVENNNTVRKLQEVPLNINKDDYFHTEEFVIDANEAGVQRFRIQVNGVAGEVTGQNNTKDIFIDVLDARQKILILANAPHPDLTTFKQIISQNKNYQVAITYIDKMQQNIRDFDFVILHQIPSKLNTALPLLKQLDDNKIPRLFVLGSQSNISAFNKAQSILSINNSRNNTNEVQGVLDNTFNLFTIEDNLPREAGKYPPVVAPFGEYVVKGKAQVLMNQKIGAVETKYPLLLFGEERGIKVGVFSGEGIWKWRLFDYLQRKNFEIFDGMMDKTFQYLTLKEDKRKFRVNVSKNIYDENEPIYLDAELYNQSYELINEPDATLIITNSDGKDFNYTFNKTANAYTLKAGFFPVGNYVYEGKVNVNGQQLTHKGKFSVQPIQLEIFETTADHNLLRLLGDKYDGGMVFSDQLASIPELIKAKGNVKPKIYDTFKTRNVINLKWIFWLLLLLLSVEWFFRRYFGGY